ncbi:MAG: response regulator transcription factor [Sediminibacterium sp. Gen4]|jgi:two-component system, OmpR family, copper resistance phosphate regulon response regulator CusR|uniref:response regulator transcription factor n=1 Tax=unclassified Sediminibacterium TaxID=2635961 RepID=UPI0015BB571D|nr:MULTISPECIES: response regulator transcription factor [unclassified Sediminibacterium]MBW0162268.1 response regulator transcription factor [Sediminibacterium sp.]MBW0165328.1 response regulator transcription factor [Sediminibacterium sp.]NWK65117.1 response regulator transcription factor [Sediminibacterium sp. Gen4]
MENPHSILLVEDEAKLGPIIRDELRRQGYLVDLAIDGKEAEEAFQNKLYSIVLLDVNLPYKSGLELCKEFRAANKTIPIIMLTAIGQIQDKVEAFDLGADDYLVKPFHFEELFVRVKALLKRTDKGHEDEKIIVDDLTIDMKNKSVVRAGMNINLTAKEFTLLTLLARNRERVISKQEILEKVWDLTFDTGTNTIEVYISFLRNKIDKPFEQKLIHTKPGFGYYIK